ncbi:MAG: VapC toxin family PIN domain ribonuclease [Noviherbaspirillum sp.]
MSVIIDTSVWVDHFRNRNDVLINLLQTDLALTHQMVLVELACGTPPAPRTRTLGEIALLRSCDQANLDEVINFIERRKLYELGYGLVDTALLASTLITPGARLWTLDKRLAALAERYEMAFQSKFH